MDGHRGDSVGAGKQFQGSVILKSTGGDKNMTEVMEDITVDEKRDMLLEMLADLYMIKAANKEENAV